MPISTFTMVLKETYMPSPSVKHFIFLIESPLPFEYIAGQFITIHFEAQEKKIKRSYSIANVPMKNNSIEFAANFVEDGPGSTYLFNLKLNDIVTASGPFGRLILKEETPKRYIFIATSTGVTPYRAMLNELDARLKNNPELKVVILLGVKNQEEGIYKDEFIAFAKRHPNRVIFRLQLSSATQVEMDECEYKGRIQQAFSDLALNPQEDIVYLCGNPSMIDDSFADLKNKGFELQQIIREKYISTK